MHVCQHQFRNLELISCWNDDCHSFPSSSATRGGREGAQTDCDVSSFVETGSPDYEIDMCRRSLRADNRTTGRVCGRSSAEGPAETDISRCAQSFAPGGHISASLYNPHVEVLIYVTELL